MSRKDELIREAAAEIDRINKVLKAIDKLNEEQK